MTTKPLVITPPPSTRTKSKKHDRVANDLYPTEAAYTEVMLQALPVGTLGKDDIIAECCAGYRDIVGVLHRHGYSNVISTDIADAKDDRYNATLESYWQSIEPIDWVITNPPFNVASPIIQLAYKFARKGVIFLLPISFYEPATDSDGSNKSKGLPALYDKSKFIDRHVWLDANADQQTWKQTLNPRPRFRDDTNNTDSKTVCWSIWRKDWSWLKLGVEPPFRYDRGFRDRENPRLTQFHPAAPKSTPERVMQMTNHMTHDAFDLVQQAIEIYEQDLQQIGDIAPRGHHLTEIKKGGKPVKVARFPSSDKGTKQTQVVAEVKRVAQSIANRETYDRVSGNLQHLRSIK